MAGTIQILNVAAGDVKLTFDKDNPAELIRAKRIVRDMLRRGYALLIEVERNGERAYERALDFDEAKGEYILADLDPAEAATADEKERGEVSDGIAKKPTDKPHRGRRKRVAADAATAVGIGRSAGG